MMYDLGRGHTLVVSLAVDANDPGWGRTLVSIFDKMGLTCDLCRGRTNPKLTIKYLIRKTVHATVDCRQVDCRKVDCRKVKCRQVVKKQKTNPPCETGWPR